MSASIKNYQFFMAFMVITFILPANAKSGVKKIWPSQFNIAYFGGESVAQVENRFQKEPRFIRGVGSIGCYLYAPVTIPAGKKVTKLVMVAEGTDLSAVTSAELYRFKMLGSEEQMAYVQSLASESIHEEVDDTIANDTVRKSFRYYIRIYVKNQYSYFHGARIYYR